MAKYCLVVCLAIFAGCTSTQLENSQEWQADYVIINGQIIDGGSIEFGPGSVVEVTGSRISYVGPPRDTKARRVIDAQGLIVSPGFIDPHTHADRDLFDPATSLNEAYLRQGVTTVFIGNDGGGGAISETKIRLAESRLGTNVGLLRGQGALRTEIVGVEDRQPTAQEMQRMKEQLRSDMQAGALGMSTGLFYAPGSFTSTAEVVELARVVAEYGGIYDSHIRDESDYNIGLVAAIEEVLTIAREAKIAVHIAHLKALGPSVHGAADEIVNIIRQARADGLQVTADQYPWLASGTRLSNALIPRRLMDGGAEAMNAKLRNPETLTDIRPAFEANLIRRGGPDALLITGESIYRGKTLGELAVAAGKDFLEMTVEVVLSGDPAIASFMMRQEDLEKIVVEPWVVTGSDGSSGHPRKFATFPQKYREFVIKRGLLSVREFVRQSSSATAQIFGLCDRGVIAIGKVADIAIWDANNFRANATYEAPTELASGVVHLLVNGELTISQTALTGAVAGVAIARSKCE